MQLAGAVTLEDGGLPFALPVTDAAATAPFWAGANRASSSLHITTAVTAAAWRVARHDPAVAAHEWLDRATRYCLDTMAARSAAEHAIELLFVLDLLDTLVDGPGPPEAEALLARFAATLRHRPS